MTLRQLLTASLSLVLLVSCLPVATARADAEPASHQFRFRTIDEAACGCLQWAWSLDRKRELAGGVLQRDTGLACSPLTRGSEATVTFQLRPHWLASFHTHTWGPGGNGEEMSSPDRRISRVLDPRSRPVFVRTPKGRVLKYHRGRTTRVACPRGP